MFSMEQPRHTSPYPPPSTPWSAEAEIAIPLPSELEREIGWVSCAPRGLTIAGDDGLTTEQFFLAQFKTLWWKGKESV